MSTGDLVRACPSSFIPYPKGSKIRIRDLRMREADVLGQAKESKDELRLIEAVRECVMLEGVAYEDLTVGDWFFLLLSVLAKSFFDLKYRYGKPCPHCQGQIEKIDLGVKDSFGNPIVIEKEGVATKEFQANEIDFKSITSEDIPDLPVEVELDSGSVVEVDFFRIRHYIKLLDEKLSGVEELRLILKGEFDDLTIRDLQVLKYVREKMDHGPNPELVLKCPICQKEIKVQTEWRGLDFAPKSLSESDTRRRVRFGSRTAPVTPRNPRVIVPEGDGAIPTAQPIQKERGKSVQRVEE